MELIRKYGVIAIILVAAVLVLGYGAGKRAALDDNAQSADKHQATDAAKR